MSSNISNVIKSFFFLSDKSKDQLEQTLGYHLPKIHSARIAFHFGSAILGYFIVKNTLGQTLYDSGIWNWFTVLICIGWVLMIEILFALFFRSAFRQLFRFHFSSFALVLVFIITVGCATGSLVYSYNLSTIGGEEKVSSLAKVYNKESDSKLIEERDIEKDKRSKDFNQRIKNEKSLFIESRKNIKSLYKSRILFQDSEYKRYERLKANGKSWAQGWMDKIKVKKARLIHERDSEIASANSTKIKKTLSIEKEKALALEVVQNNWGEKISQHNKAETLSYDSSVDTKDRYGYIGFMAGFVFVIAGSVLIMIEEIYFVGTGKTHDQIAAEREQGYTYKYIKAIGEILETPQRVGLYWLKKLGAYLEVTFNTDFDNNGKTGNVGGVSINLDVSKKNITASVPVKTPTLPEKETATTHVGTRLSQLEQRNPTVKNNIVTTVDAPIVEVSNVFPTNSTTVGIELQPLEITVEKGLKYALWNGEKRDARWVKKQISAYVGKKKDKIKRNRPYTTEDDRILQLTTVLQRLEE